MNAEQAAPGGVTPEDHAGQMKRSRLVFYEEDVAEFDKILGEFLNVSHAKCVLMIDKEGHLVTKKGFTKSFDSTSIAALVAGSFASTREMARQLGESEFSVLFHQGRNENIHISLVADRVLLATIFDDRTTIGMVRLYADQLAQKIAEVFAKAEAHNASRPQRDIGEGFGESAKERLDDFFKE